MRICVIMNENAGSADQAELLHESMGAHASVTCRRTTEKGHGIELAEQAAREGFDVVAAAGGDGTINEVVNGLMRADDRPILGVIPLGTGNDLARMLDIPLKDAAAALDLIETGERRWLDTYRMETPSTSCYGINAAAGGFSGKVNEALTSELKSNWGPIAYLIGAASVIPEISDYDSYLTIDDGVPELIRAFNVVIANGRTIAGGKRISPLSNPEDGLLDVVIIERGSVVEMGDLAARLVAGNLFASDLVSHRRARKVHLESEPRMWFNLDGELLTQEPITIEVQPRSIEVVVGPDYTPEVSD